MKSSSYLSVKFEGYQIVAHPEANKQEESNIHSQIKDGTFCNVSKQIHEQVLFVECNSTSLSSKYFRPCT